MPSRWLQVERRSLEAGAANARLSTGGAISADSLPETGHERGTLPVGICAANWREEEDNKPSSRACGACHDKFSFDATASNARVGHPGGPQPNDAGCSTCHRPGGPGGDTAAWHIPVSLPDSHNIYADASAAGNANTNAAYVAAAGAVPPGAGVIKYVVNSVSTWTDTASGNVLRPQIAFKIQLDGKDVVFPDPSTASELVPGFVGSPSAYFVFALPEDGISAPADFNASASAYLRNIWNGTGTCSNAASTTTRTGADRHRSHADQRRRLLLAAERGVHPAATGAVRALSWPRRRGVNLHPACIHAVIDGADQVEAHGACFFTRP